MTQQVELDETIDLRNIFAILRRRVRLILATVVTVLAAAVVVLLLLEPKYTATTLILVDPSAKNLLNANDAASLSSQGENARVESEVEIARSSAITLAAIEELNLLTDPEFGPRLSKTDKLRTLVGLPTAPMPSGTALLQGTLRRVADATSVRRRGLTYVFSISATSVDPNRAASLANTLAETYIRLQIESKTNGILASRNLLSGQIDSARKTLAASNDSVDTFLMANLAELQLETGNDAFSAYQYELGSLTGERVGLSNSLLRAEGTLDRQDWGELAQALEDDALAALVEQRNQLQSRLEGSVPSSADAIDLRAQLTALETELRSSAEENIGQLLGQVSQVESRLDQIRREVRSTALSSDLSSVTLAALFELQQESDIAQRQYTTLLSRLRDLEAQALVQVADARIVSQALAPNNPSFPNKKLILAGASVFALALGFGLALMKEFFIGGIVSEGQLTNILPAPVATTVPWIKPSRDQLSVADTVVSSPLSAYSESLRRLRAALDQRLLPEQGRGAIILLCSADPAEGKSTLSLALARTYKALGLNTVLIDADLRKPSIHGYLGAAPEKGLLDFLKNPTETEDLAEISVVDPLSQLVSIVGRGRSDIPTDQLLLTNVFSALLEQSKSSADITVIDSPPVNSVVDAQLLAPFADAIILSVRFGTTSQYDVRSAYQRLAENSRPGTPILTVLNQDTEHGSSKDDYGYYGY